LEGPWKQIDGIAYARDAATRAYAKKIIPLAASVKLKDNYNWRHEGYKI